MKTRILLVDGFEVMGGRYDGIKMNGDHNTIRNCWVHNNKAMGIAMHHQNRIANNTIVDRSSPLTIWRGDGEVVVNNILVGDQAAVSLDDRTGQILFDHNLCVPESAAQGPRGLTGDPRFVDATRGVFWLRANSPAISKGSPEHAPAHDFWGRSLPKDRPSDLGAFPYEPVLEKDETRAHWDHRWAYHRHSQKTNILPDLWTLPQPNGR